MMPPPGECAGTRGVRAWFRQMRAANHREDARRLDSLRTWVRTSPSLQSAARQWALLDWFRHDADHYAVLATNDIDTRPLIFLFPVTMPPGARQQLRNQLHLQHDFARRTREALYHYGGIVD